MKKLIVPKIIVIVLLYSGFSHAASSSYYCAELNKTKALVIEDLELIKNNNNVGIAVSSYGTGDSTMNGDGTASEYFNVNSAPVGPIANQMELQAVGVSLNSSIAYPMNVQNQKQYLVIPTQVLAANILPDEMDIQIRRLKSVVSKKTGKAYTRKAVASLHCNKQ